MTAMTVRAFIAMLSVITTRVITITLSAVVGVVIATLGVMSIRATILSGVIFTTLIATFSTSIFATSTSTSSSFSPFASISAYDSASTSMHTEQAGRLQEHGLQTDKLQASKPQTDRLKEHEPQASRIQANGLQASRLIDRYTAISPIETLAQKDPLSVVVSIKFAKSIFNVKQAIEQLLTPSGYKLNQDHNVEKIRGFSLPKVHQQLGPMPLKRMIRVLLGSAWDLHTDHPTRTIQIVKASNTLQVLTPEARVMLKEVIVPSVLGEVVVVSINHNLLLPTLKKILPKDWRVVLSDDAQDLALKTVSVVSEDSSREVIVKKILTDVGAQGFFYQKLKLLVVQNHQQNNPISTSRVTQKKQPQKIIK